MCNYVTDGALNCHRHWAQIVRGRIGCIKSVEPVRKLSFLVSLMVLHGAELTD